MEISSNQKDTSCILIGIKLQLFDFVQNTHLRHIISALHYAITKTANSQIKGILVLFANPMEYM